MKKILSILACAAAVLSACQKEEMPSLSFESATYVMGADDAVTVKAVVSDAPAADLAVAFTTSGTAVLGTDYELSAESFVIKAGETAAEVVVTPKNNLGADLNITLTLTLPTGYQAGNFTATNIALGSKEKVAYSFAKQESKLVNELDVTLNLIGLASGANFTAGGNYELPFVIAPASTAVAGTDFEVKGGATAFVFEKGAKSATITLVAKGEVEGSKDVIIKLDEAAIAAAYGDRFSAGVIAEAKVVITKGIIFSDLEGKWAYASSPLIHDESVDKMMLEMMMEEAFENLDTYPTGTSNDILEFKVKEDKKMLIPTGNGTVMNYFKECEVSGFTPNKYRWYYYNDTGSMDDMGREYDVAEVTLSKANLAYSSTVNTENQATIRLNLSADGNTLNVFITEYTPTDFLKETYGVADLSGMLELYYMLFDLHFTFTKVAE